MLHAWLSATVKYWCNWDAPGCVANGCAWARGAAAAPYASYRVRALFAPGRPPAAAVRLAVRVGLNADVRSP